MATLQLELMNSLQPELQVLGAQLLARAAKRAKLKSSEKLSKQMPKGITAKLKSLAQEGPMKAAKAAVLALASILDTGAAEKVRCTWKRPVQLGQHSAAIEAGLFCANFSSGQQLLMGSVGDWVQYVHTGLCH